MAAFSQSVIVAANSAGRDPSNLRMEAVGML